MYLRECFIENVGPIAALDVSLSLDSLGNPKPLILVGKNGTGKTIFLAYVLDALAELAKKKFSDIAIGQQIWHTPFFKLSSGGDIRSLSGGCLSLLEFSDEVNNFCYVEKVGQVAPQDYTSKLRGRFQPVQSWEENVPIYKVVTGDDLQIETFFQNGAICFFPSSRHECPHWLNLKAIDDQPLFSNNQRMAGELKKALIVERAAKDNQQWLMDVFIDSLVDGVLVENFTPEGNFQIQWQPDSDFQNKILLKKGRQNVELVLRLVLEDEKAQMVLNYRNAVYGRIAIRLGNDVIIPSLTHLSAGQALLFNLFATIIRYADHADCNKSIKLHEIKGIVLIDEIDAHLHTDLQYSVLPKLIKMFPKVQFIITSHAPLFLLGMEREFGADGIQILEMPTGKKISTERFDEFSKSFEYYRQTLLFEDAVEQQVKKSSLPLVFTEGQTDADYIKTALKLLGYTELLSQLEIAQVGKPGEKGTQGGGCTNLDKAIKFLENNQSCFPRRVLFLYDCDTKKKASEVGFNLIRCIPLNPQNTKVTKGIENLFPVELFKERFYKISEKPTEYGSKNIISEFQKQDFCEWICKQRKEKNDFIRFEELVVPIIKEFLEHKLAKIA